MWKPYLKFITKRFLDIIPHTESSSSSSLSLCSRRHRAPRKFKIIDFRLLLKFMLKNSLFLFMFVSETNFLCHPHPNPSPTPAIEPQNKVEPKKNQIKVTAENKTTLKRLKIVVVQQKQSKKFAFSSVCSFLAAQKFCGKKLSPSKVHLKVVIAWVCSWISPHFPFCWKKNLFATPSFVVCGSRNVYNHLKYITGSINVTMPTAHIFAIFHHNFFVLLLYARRQFFCCVQLFARRRRRWDLEKLHSTIFKNWKIVSKECQKHFHECFSRVRAASRFLRELQAHFKSERSRTICQQHLSFRMGGKSFLMTPEN